LKALKDLCARAACFVIFLIAITITSDRAQTEEWKKISGFVPPVRGEWSGTNGIFSALVVAQNSPRLIAIGRLGLIRTSDDGGDTWSDRISRIPLDLFGISALPDRRIVAVGAAGVVLQSKDDGATWEIPSHISNDELRGIVFLPNTRTLIAVGRRGTVVRGVLKDGQIRWDPPSRQGVQDLFAITAVPNSNLVMAVGGGGTAISGIVTEDGVQWAAPTKHGEAPFFAIAPVPGSDILIAVGAAGSVLQGRVVETVVQWGPVSKQTEVLLVGIAGAPTANSMMAVGERGTIIRGLLVAGELKWETFTQQGERPLFAVAAMPSVGRMIAIGADGVVARWNPDGTELKWNSDTLDGVRTFGGITSLPNTNVVLAVGADGYVMRGVVTDNRVQWDPPTKQADQHLYGITTIPNTKIVIAVGVGTIIQGTVTDKEVQWALPIKPAGLNRTLYAVAPIPNTPLVIAVGQGGAILRGVVNGGQVQWDTSLATPSEGKDLRAIIALPNTNTVLAVGASGTALRGAVVGTQVQWESPESTGAAGFLTGIASVPNTKQIVVVGDEWVRRGTVNADHIDWDPSPVQIEARITAIAPLPSTGSLVAVGLGGYVGRSQDGGETWVQQLLHAPMDLFSVTSVSGRFISAGTRGTATGIGEPEQLASANEYSFSFAEETLTLDWRYPPGASVDCTRVMYDTGVMVGFIEAAIPKIMKDGRTGFSVTWSPKKEGVAGGSKIHYSVECIDTVLQVRWLQPLPETQTFLAPPSIFKQAWNWSYALPIEKLVLLISSISLALWFCVLILLWTMLPRRLVALYEWLPSQPASERQGNVYDKVAAAGSQVARSVGAGLLVSLGTSRRALDAWVSESAPRALENFLRLEVVADRQRPIDLPLLFGGVQSDDPWRQLDRVFREPPVTLLISGVAGAGKTTLACAIGRRMLGHKGLQPPGGSLAIPLLINKDLTSESKDLNPEGAEKVLLTFLAGELRAVTRATSLSLELAGVLVRAGRVLVIIDGISERNKPTQQILRAARSSLAIPRLVATSRDFERAGIGIGIAVETPEIPPGRLYDFIATYIDRTLGEKPRGAGLSPTRIHEACGQLTRLLRRKATTPLFAILWAEELMLSSNTASTRIHGVAELVDSYVGRLLSPASSDLVKLEALRRDLESIAIDELGDNFAPQWLTRARIIKRVRENSSDDPESRIQILLISGLVEQDTRNDELMRIKLDPVAEHLVARAKTEQMAGDETKWGEFLDLLQAKGWPPDFVDALVGCVRARGYGHSERPLSAPIWKRLISAQRRSLKAKRQPR